MAAANPTARGKRIHLCEFEADNLAEGLNQFLNVKLRFRESGTAANRLSTL
jgi:hypothetical protein